MLPDIEGVSKKFDKWSNTATATWVRCARMHMAIRRHLMWSTSDWQWNVVSVRGRATSER